jgi:hypothetical protein
MRHAGVKPLRVKQRWRKCMDQPVDGWSVDSFNVGLFRSKTLDYFTKGGNIGGYLRITK